MNSKPFAIYRISCCNWRDCSK